MTMSLTKGVTFADFADAQARLDEGVDLPGDQALADAYDAELDAAWEQYERERHAAEQLTHETESGEDPDGGGYWWTCTWGGDEPGYLTEAEMIGDRDGHEHN